MQFTRFIKIALMTTVAAAITTESFAIEAASKTALNVRTGPGTNFAIVDTLHQGEVVDVAECQTSGWCYITHTGSDGWVSGKYLAQVQPGNSGQSSSGQNNSSSGSSDSDDAAAAAAFAAILGIGALMVGSAMSQNNNQQNSNLPHGPDTCKQGYVWRDAIPGDHVCVTPQRRAKAAQENATAGARVDPNGAFGPNSCKPGFVWREAYQGDVVCVTPFRRGQVKQENIDGPSHRVQP